MVSSNGQNSRGNLLRGNPATQFKSGPKAAEMGRRGGIASGVSKRRARDAAQLAVKIMDSGLTGKLHDRVKSMAPALDSDELTVTAAMVAGQVQAAIGGSTKAMEYLEGLREKAEKDADAAPFRLSPLDLTSDYVDAYRDVHAVFDGELDVREMIFKGGRGTIKSTFVAKVAYETIMQDRQAHVVFTRRYKVDLRHSVYTMFERVVRAIGDVDEWDFTTSPMQARYRPTGQTVLFVGCDKPISLKSAGVAFGYVKLVVNEECDEMAGIEQMDSVEDTFLRADTPALSVKIFNPPKSKSNFMNAYAAEKATDPATRVYHSYYYHVPVKWLGQRFFDRAEWFRLHKPDYYRNNYLGEATGTGGELFANVVEEAVGGAQIDAWDMAGMTYQGIDWGFEHPQVFVRVAYDREADTVYIFHERYRRRCKLSTFFRGIMRYKRQETICDSAEPDKIADAQDMGWEAVPAVKRWRNGGGRDYAWEWLRSRERIVVDPARCPMLAHELRTLEFEQLKDGTFSSRYPDLGEDGVMATIYALNRVIIDSKEDEAYPDDEGWDEEYIEEWEDE